MDDAAALLGTIDHIVVDCADPKRLARFWSALLGLPVAFEGGAYVALDHPPDGSAALLFQAVPRPTPGKNRLHVDVNVTDLEGATAQVERHGGRRDGDDPDVTEFGLTWRRMRDLEDNVFCLVSRPPQS